MRRALIQAFLQITLVAFAGYSIVAKAQDLSMKPKISVLGVYSPRANGAEYDAFLSREVASRNPINFSEETKAFLKRVGRGSEIVGLSPDELAEIREALDHDLSGSALIEVLVSNPDQSFSVGAFTQPNATLPEGRWQVAWCEKFLTPDGAALLGDYTLNKLPLESQLRLVFYIHDWQQERGLNGPYGSLTLPPIQPMPSRLWKLAPYEQVD